MRLEPILRRGITPAMAVAKKLVRLTDGKGHTKEPEDALRCWHICHARRQFTEDRERHHAAGGAPDALARASTEGRCGPAVGTSAVTYYNEIDPHAAQWLRNLIAGGHIPAGWVDTRSIVDVSPHELTPYCQQHFFAGVAGWALALRLAGWPDDRPVRTGSCPCQPFSVAGKGLKEKDPRHLWPYFRDLIAFGEPTITFGEQVASHDGRDWLAGVRADLENLGYEVGAADLCAACVGAPDIRQRLYWVADPKHAIGRPVDKHGEDGCDRQDTRRQEAHSELGTCGEVCRLADQPRRGLGADGSASGQPGHAEQREQAGRLGFPNSTGSQPGGITGEGDGHRDSSKSASLNAWSDSRSIFCSDGKTRRIPVEPRFFPLVNGIPSRLGPLLTALQPMGRSAIKAARSNVVIRLKGYGNAIVPELAAAFILASTHAKP